MMWKLKFILLAVFLMPVEPSPVPRRPVEAVSELWLDVSIGGPMVEWFNGAARPTDIARLENAGQANLLDNIAVGRKMVIFRSVGDAERLLPDMAADLDIIGYNLESGPFNPETEQADPVGSVRRMRELADEYDLALAFGPDHDIALSHGAAIAPYVDIFVLQVQRVQTERQTVYEFVRPLIPRLREANPDLKVSIQIRTEGDVVSLADLVESLKDDLDGVSILTSPDTIEVAQALVEELRGRTPPGEPQAGQTAVPDNGDTAETAALLQRGRFISGGVILACAVGVGLTIFLIHARDNR